jgi:hypothetical protein
MSWSSGEREQFIVKGRLANELLCLGMAETGRCKIPGGKAVLIYES